MSRIASREPAAVELTGALSRSDLLWVANTAHGPGGHWHARPRDGEPDHDHLADPDSAWRYLVDHRVSVPAGLPDPAALRELVLIRALVQAAADGAAEPWSTAARELLAAARFELGADGQLTGGPGWPGFCRDLLVAWLGLLASGAGLRRCANPACRLVFEDASRNHARRWCDTAGCGNRDRVRRARWTQHEAVTSGPERRPREE